MIGQRANAALRTIREDAFVHWVALVVAIVIGLGAAHLHWLGLVLGGALVGLVAASLSRAIVAGIGFGILVVVVWLGTIWWAGTLSKVLAMGELALLGAALGIVLPAVGSLVRGIV